MLADHDEELWGTSMACGGGRPVVVLITSAGRDGSTLLFNMLRLVLQRQFVAVRQAGFVPHRIPFVEWDDWVSDFGMQLLIKVHEVRDEWMVARRRDGTELVDLVFTARRNPVEAVCSELWLKNQPEGLPSNEALVHVLWLRYEFEQMMQRKADRWFVPHVDYELLADSNRWVEVLKFNQHELKVHHLYHTGIV